MNCLECKARLYPENPEVGFLDFRAKRYLPPLCQGCSNASEKETNELADRVSNLEAISAQAGRIPRQYYDRFRQMQGELAFLRNRVNELLGGQVKKPKLEGVKL